MAYGLLQHDFARSNWRGVCAIRRAHRSAVHARSDGDSASGKLFANHQLRKYRIRVRHGDAAGVQWGGRYDYSDDRELFWFLAAGNSTCLVSRDPHAHAGEGSLFFDSCRGSRDRRDEHSALQARLLEETANLTVYLA